nr:HNH endonuclease signature motif containing protein [Fredinandcohnia onubensis]
MNKFYKSSSWIRKREKILKRDDFLCRECRRYGRSTEATTIHHIHPLHERPELRLTNWNLLSLCSKCHDKMHDRITNVLTELGEQWRGRATPPTFK